MPSDAAAPARAGIPHPNEGAIAAVLILRNDTTHTNTSGSRRAGAAQGRELPTRMPANTQKDDR